MILFKVNSKSSIYVRLLYSMAVLCLLTALSSCSDDDAPAEIIPNPDSEIYFTKSLDFTSDSGEAILSFTTNKDWSINVSQLGGDVSWCTVFPNKGKAGENQVLVKVIRNEGVDDRNVVLNLAAGDLTKSIVVTQKQKDAITLTTAKFEVDKNGGEIQVEVKANVTYEVVIPEQYQSWIREGSGSGQIIMGDKGHNQMHESATRTDMDRTMRKFYISKSEEYDKREGEIIFRSGELEEVLKVYQTGGGILLLTKNEYTVSDKGEQITVELNSNFDFDVKMPQVDWITTTVTRSVSSHTLYYTVTPNETYDKREAEIIYYDRNDKSVADTLKIVQVQKDAILLSQKEYSVGCDEEYIEVEVNANVDFEVQIENSCTSWITMVENLTTKGLVSRKVNFKIKKNTSYDERVGEIVIKDKKGGLSETVIVRQAGVISIVVDKTSYSLNHKGGDLSFEVKTNVNLTIEISVDWIKQIDTRSIESKILHFIVNENLTENVREGIINLYGDGFEKAIKVMQAPQPQSIDLGLSVEWSNLNIGASSSKDSGGYYKWADPTGTKQSVFLKDYPSSNPPMNISGTEYDIAHMQWGDGWRLPTLDEFRELCSKCSTKWNGSGYTFVGPNGNSLVLPAGHMDGATLKVQSIYWSGTLSDVSDEEAYVMLGEKYSLDYRNSRKRNMALSVRPVKDKRPTRPEAIDLGLSVKWANYNVGATKPAEYVGLYGWADPTGKNTSTDNNLYPNSNPPSNICNTEYDIAHVQWGRDWRMPSKAELDELYRLCTWKWTERNGINGYQVIGPNGNSIFLPAAGMRKGLNYESIGKTCYYWSGTLDDKYFFNASLFMARPNESVWSGQKRYVGASIRPVCGKSNVYSGNIEIYSQRELYELDKKGYTEISGDLQIVGNDITNIPDFTTLKKIGGLLEFNNCNSMTLCSGFINLDVINNGFRILNCENLNRIEGFNSLNCIRLSKNANGYQGLTIDNCKNLKKIVGFNNLESIIGPFYLDHIDKLESIEGFRKLKKIDHWTSITYAKELSSIKGFDVLESAGSEIRLYEVNKLTDISFLSNVKTVDFIYLETPMLNDLSPIKNMDITNWLTMDCSNLTEIELNIPTTLTGLFLKNCSMIQKASCFYKLEKIKRFQIEGNVSTYILETFANVKSVSQLFMISNVNNITTLDAFSNLSIIGNESGFTYKLRILDNKNLINYDGIKNAINSSLSCQISGNKYNPSIADILAGKQYGDNY